jgi:hypothetical protein
MMRAFFRTHAGKGTGAMYVAALILAYPPSLSFLAAGIAFVFAIDQFRQSFRQVRLEAARPQQATTVDVTATTAVAGKVEDNLPAVLVKEHAANAVSPDGQEELPDWLRSV